MDMSMYICIYVCVPIGNSECVWVYMHGQEYGARCLHMGYMCMCV